MDDCSRRRGRTLFAPTNVGIWINRSHVVGAHIVRPLFSLVFFWVGMRVLNIFWRRRKMVGCRRRRGRTLFAPTHLGIWINRNHAVGAHIVRPLFLLWLFWVGMRVFDFFWYKRTAVLIFILSLTPRLAVPFLTVRKAAFAAANATKETQGRCAP